MVLPAQHSLHSPGNPELGEIDSRFDLQVGDSDSDQENGDDDVDSDAEDVAELERLEEMQRRRAVRFSCFSHLTSASPNIR